VLVDDGQIIVLGGLLQDALSGGQDKVPLLGDVPVLGSLFRYDTRKRSKTNLMVFLRPTVVRDAAQASNLSNDRYNYVIGEQKKSVPEEKLFWGDSTAPVLPPQPQAPATPLPAATSTPPK
jgi:general secretion pathway protein D